MLMVHFENPELLRQKGLDRGVVKYLNFFLKWADGPDAFETAKANASNFFGHAKFIVNRFKIELGVVWGASVKLACFILEPRPADS